MDGKQRFDCEIMTFLFIFQAVFYDTPSFSQIQLFSVSLEMHVTHCAIIKDEQIGVVSPFPLNDLNETNPCGIMYE